MLIAIQLVLMLSIFVICISMFWLIGVVSYHIYQKHGIGRTLLFVFIWPLAIGYAAVNWRDTSLGRNSNLPLILFLGGMLLCFVMVFVLSTIAPQTPQLN